MSQPVLQRLKTPAHFTMHRCHQTCPLPIYRVIRKSLYELRGCNVEVKIWQKCSIPLFLNELYFRVMSSIGITEVNHFANNRLKLMSIHKVVLRMCSVAALLHSIQLFTFASGSVGYSIMAYLHKQWVCGYAPPLWRNTQKFTRSTGTEQGIVSIRRLPNHQMAPLHISVMWPGSISMLNIPVSEWVVQDQLLRHPDHRT